MTNKYIENKYYIAIFESRNQALRIYQYLNKTKHNQYSIISTPRQTKGGCSFSIKFLNLDDYELLEKLCKSSNVKISGVYAISRQGGKRTTEKLNL